MERAIKEGWRSRAVFKLEQIQAKERILSPGISCVDLGASPGGWSQYAAQLIGSGGRLWAVDVQPMDPIPGVVILCGDLGSPETVTRLRAALAGQPVDLVMSDMAPNISGNRAVDQPRAMELAEAALLLTEDVLRHGGSFLVKLFQGEGFEAFVDSARARFQAVRLLKPAASRPESREMYLLARNYGM